MEEEEEWDTDDEPEDDSLMDEGVVSIRALKGGVIREGVEMDSPRDELRALPRRHV